MNNSTKSFIKWVGGILGTVIAGFLLWWLTNDHNNNKTVTPTSIENPPPPEKKAHVVISKFDLQTPINIGETATASFEVTNDGNDICTSCQLIWSVPAGLNNSLSSEVFNLGPGEKKIFTLTSNSIPENGNLTTTANLNCSNINAEKVERPLVVQFMMGAGSRHLPAQ
jgi:hypothetical protein